MSRTVVGIVYHNADFDGKGSAAVVANNQSRDAQIIYHGVNYKKSGQETREMEDEILKEDGLLSESLRRGFPPDTSDHGCTSGRKQARLDRSPPHRY